MKPTALRIVPLTTVAAALAILTGCSAIQHSNDTLEKSARRQASITDQVGSFKDDLTDRNRRVQAGVVDKPWIVGKAIPLAREVTLPQALRRDVNTALMFKGGASDLQTIADRVQMASGINTRVTADALMPQEAFMPRLKSDKSESVQPLIQMPSTAYFPEGIRPLPDVLDTIGARLSVHWKFDDVTQTIVFYRVETRAFNVRALLTSASVDAGIGLSGRGSGNADSKSGTNFDSTSKTTLKSEEKGAPIEAVMRKVEAFLTKAGSVEASPNGTNSIVITDTVEALRKVDEFLELENRALTRRVRFLFEEVTVAVNDSHEAGLDWNLIYKTASAVASAASPVSSVGSTAGTVASGGVGSGPFVGSDAIIKALSEIGTTNRKTTIPLQALNRRPVTYADRKTFSYIENIETTGLTSSSSGGTSISTVPNVSVRQKDATVGQFLTLVPDAQADGQILLTISYDSTIADPLKAIKFGDEKSGLQIQQLTVRGNGVVQQVALVPGQPMLISGFQKDEDQTSRRRVDDKAPILFGGSNATTVTRVYTLLLVTAQVDEGF